MKVLCILLYVTFASAFYIDNNETHENKIVGGHNVRIEDVPYQASLLWFRVDNFCGATIIHEFWVITAAHCIQNEQHMSVRTGSKFREFAGKLHRIQNITKHDYVPNIRNNDIALIELRAPIEFNNQQQLIELAKPHNIPRIGELVRISGFGKIGAELPKSDFLKAAHMPVTDQENCQRVYRPFQITNNMFCAGNGEADPCKGDSGGPGVIHGKLYGIISFGTNCNSTIYPGVFTRMHMYHNWIEEKTGLRF